MKSTRSSLLLTLLLCLALLTGCGAAGPELSFSLDDLPPYEEAAYVALNDNLPAFTEEDLTTEPFEFYTPLDGLDRCGTAFANVCLETMPTEKRGNISQVKPSGWCSAEYDFVDGKHLYNRCHLIGFQLTAENANWENLITGTRYLNVEGMLPFENLIADYVKETGNHVLYRVTPVFEGSELVARGVQMEALSVEDEGEGVCFNVYAYNVQPGVVIDYATGESWEADAAVPGELSEERTYVLNTKSGKFHLPDCSGASGMNEDNRREVTCSREELLAEGYSPCGTCKP